MFVPLRHLCLLLLPLAGQCVSVTVGANQYVTASLAYLVPEGCFKVLLSVDSDFSGVLFANVNTAIQLARGGLRAPNVSKAADTLSFGPSTNYFKNTSPGAAYAYLTANTAFAQPPGAINSRWTTGLSCLIGLNYSSSCYGFMGENFMDTDPVFDFVRGPEIVLTVMYLPTITANTALGVNVDVWPCGVGETTSWSRGASLTPSVYLSGGIAPWQNVLPVGQQFMPEEEQCYNIYYTQLGDVDLPLSPDKNTCLACGKLGVCPIRASLYNAFYLGFKVPDSLVVRAAVRVATSHERMNVELACTACVNPH